MVWVCIPSHNTIMRQYIAMLCSSGFGSQSQRHLASAIHLFNSSVPLSEAINSEVILLTCHPKRLSSKLDDHLFKVIWTRPLLLKKLTCFLFPSLMQHHGYLSLLQRVLVYIWTIPNSRLPLMVAWPGRFPWFLLPTVP